MIRVGAAPQRPPVQPRPGSCSAPADDA